MHKPGTQLCISTHKDIIIQISCTFWAKSGITPLRKGSVRPFTEELDINLILLEWYKHCISGKKVPGSQTRLLLSEYAACHTEYFTNQRLDRTAHPSKHIITD